ncbi:acyltransferase domain-containing protein [Myxococcus stipitatus DSM 14675]|uniref:Acyltransferase domain-containing protein n=1 Tax=Myxococcus stipitatus (strain DSM 14675 / JCM 12634 / Mx s8) TaxID=1278073 RepID=L7U2Q5_MYXSD|nr:acyltransferase domain-containing protein [Myxococcus stipitatus DSM 14675]
MALSDGLDARVDRLALPFNEYGVDPYGISRKHVRDALRVFALIYRYYFRVKCHGIQHIPEKGRGMLVGNHSGGVAVDGAMVLTSTMLEMDPPRLAQGMVERFLHKFPVSSLWASRTGQFTGLPEHAKRLLEDDRLLMIFPEGARGTAKLFPDRYSLVDFGTGFIRLALQTRSPIIPFAFLGGGSAIPTVFNAYALGKLLGVPYVPLTPYLLPVPLPVQLEIHYGEPLVFHGTGDEEDHVIEGYVAKVKERIAGLIERGRAERQHRGLSRKLLP